MLTAATVSVGISGHTLVLLPLICSLIAAIAASALPVNGLPCQFSSFSIPKHLFTKTSLLKDKPDIYSRGM